MEDDSNPETYRENSIWAQNFSLHWAKNIIVSCGAYMFDGMDDEGISFKRNPDHFQPYAVLVDGVHYRFKEGVDAVWQDFKAGKIDLCTLFPNQLLELDTFLASDEYARQEANGKGINLIDYIDLSLYFRLEQCQTLFLQSQLAQSNDSCHRSPEDYRAKPQ